MAVYAISQGWDPPMIYSCGFGLGLFLASSIVGVFSVFPRSIIGAMLLMVGVSLLRFARDVKGRLEVIPMAITVMASVFTKNMAIGFASGIILFYLLKYSLSSWQKGGASG